MTEPVTDQNPGASNDNVNNNATVEVLMALCAVLPESASDDEMGSKVPERTVESSEGRVATSLLPSAAGSLSAEGQVAKSVISPGVGGAMAMLSEPQNAVRVG